MARLIINYMHPLETFSKLDGLKQLIVEFQKMISYKPNTDVITKSKEQKLAGTFFTFSAHR